MGDFDTTTLADDWGTVLTQAGPLPFVAGGVTASGIWAARYSQLQDMDEQLRDDRRFTVFTTMASIVTLPSVRDALTRSGVTYFVEAVRSDAEGVGVEIDVRQEF